MPSNTNAPAVELNEWQGSTPLRQTDMPVPALQFSAPTVQLGERITVM